MSETSAPVVETVHGRVRGRADGDVFAYLGLRYAAPPRRFEVAQPPAAWTGVAEATAYGASCPHTSRVPPGRPTPPWLDGPELPMDEDCLYLNVWTTDLAPGRKAPVMVWLHTGGFAIGSGSPPLFAGDRLAKRGDVVVVTLNHRLGALGYTALDHLDPTLGEAANVGMFDMIAALRWVRDNIAAFGGDPDCVTIFGESGGGLKVSTLMAMPAAKGLFHRAIIESGVRVGHVSPERARDATDRLAAELDPTGDPLTTLREASPEAILKAQAVVSNAMPVPGPGFQRVFGPSLNPRDTPFDPFSPQALTLSADVPLLVGYNRTEATYFHRLNFGPNDLDMTVEEADRRLAPVFGAARDDVMCVFRTASPEQTPFETYIEALTEFPTGHYTRIAAARQASAGGAPAYVYRFDWSGSVWSRTPWAPHMIELPFVFDAVDRAPTMVPVTDETHALAATVSAAWCAFARTGVPAAAALPEWPAYNPETPRRMTLNTVSRVESDLGGARHDALVRALGA